MKDLDRCGYCGSGDRHDGRHNGPGGHMFIARRLLLGVKS